MTASRLKSLLLVATSALLPSFVFAQPTAHYAPGSEGLLAATLPPPGLYARDYNLFYTADHVNFPSGYREVSATVFTYAQVPRVIWITDQKFLGANVGTDILLPFTDTRVKVDDHYNSSTFGAGDFFWEGTLSWHLQQFDFSFGAGIWAPTGDSTPLPLGSTRAGKGFWDGMLTWGGTWYTDTNKTYAVSALSRYEFNSEQNGSAITPGEAYTLEWGLSRQFGHGLSVGPVGYYQQKVTGDRGPEASSTRDRVAAVGGEFGGPIPKINVLASVRCLYEFMAEGRAQGETITLTLTKRF
jgi:hypothetical protein